jgi:hypothetical protein
LDNLPTYDDVVNHEKEKEATGLEPPTYEEALKMVDTTKPAEPDGLAGQDSPPGQPSQDATANNTNSPVDHAEGATYTYVPMTLGDFVHQYYKTAVSSQDYFFSGDAVSMDEIS